MGHAYSVSDWGVKSEREEKDRARDRERGRERERERKREKEKESKNRGTISMAQGLPGGVHLSQRSTTRSTKEQRNMKSNQQRERA